MSYNSKTNINMNYYTYTPRIKVNATSGNFYIIRDDRNRNYYIRYFKNNLLDTRDFVYLKTLINKILIRERNKLYLHKGKYGIICIKPII
jgi:hypothetical protein